MKDLVSGRANMNVVGPIDCREKPLSNNLDSVRFAEFEEDDFNFPVKRAAGVEFSAGDGVEPCEFRPQAFQPAALWLFNPAQEFGEARGLHRGQN